MWYRRKKKNAEEKKDDKGFVGIGEVGGKKSEDQCFFCRKLVDDVTKTRNGKYSCEECYDPADPEQNTEEEGMEPVELSEIAENTQKTPLKTFSNTFASESEKSKQKAIELSSEEIEQLNNQVEIPPELNIIDCPPDKNPDPEWFKKQFRNFWRLFNDDSEWTFVIHDRGSCKSKNDAIIILYNITMFNNFEGCFVMRNWEEPTRQTKEYFKKIIREFDEVIYQGERKVKKQWGLLWLSTYKGVSYKKNPTDKSGELRCHFFSLFDTDHARTLINEPIKIAVFDECIPTRKQILKGKGWATNEGSDYMELMKSVGRGTKPKKIFTGNPNDSWRNCWMLEKHFSEELKGLEKWYWKNSPSNLAEWLEWEWTFEWKKGNKTLQLKKIKTSEEDFGNYEEGNWNNFLERPEKLKIVDHKNGAVPQYIFNNCICYVSKENYFYFIRQDSKEISERDRKIINNLPERYVNDAQRMKSKQFAKWDYRGEVGVRFQQGLLRLYETDQLFFADMFAKEAMEAFIGKRKVAE